MVRDTLGEDAIIVATREENGGTTVRVTAAIEQQDPYETQNEDMSDTVLQDDPLSELRERVLADDSSDGASLSEDKDMDWYNDGLSSDDEEEAVIEQLTDVMLKHAVPEEITDQILSCATIVGLQDPEAALIAALEHLYSFQSLPEKPGGKAIMLVGPPGAGKTLMTAKLATRSVLAGHNVAVLTTDTVRAGGIEQLSAFTKLLRVPLEKANDVNTLTAALDKVKKADKIFIDTAGLNPFKPEDMRDMARLTALANIQPVLVMPAGLDAEESGEIARVFGTLGVRSMVTTRIDLARRLGGILSAAHYGGLIFADVSNTQKVAEGLQNLTPGKMANLLMPKQRKEKPKVNRSEPKQTKERV